MKYPDSEKLKQYPGNNTYAPGPVIDIAMRDNSIYRMVVESNKWSEK
jgi:hypothetical protein